MTKTILLEVPDSFLVEEPFYLDTEEIRHLLDVIEFWVNDDREIIFKNEIDVEQTIRHHTGDARLWMKSGGYISIFPTHVGITVNYMNYYADLMDYIEKEIPSLSQKYKDL